ncbi:hypothetical protein Airi02_070360 [Actinoallomurus iriomotensis]|uniref:Uncharacterized protein n=1 Tax=Actinoallomurus iriomotensis TaxID=478107 RepID=A0A9W6W3P3_9ACTN|nr:hypothetical protein Airi02_070360 [Actinoallomurus iriomotensis]
MAVSTDFFARISEFDPKISSATYRSVGGEDDGDVFDTAAVVVTAAIAAAAEAAAQCPTDGELSSTKRAIDAAATNAAEAVFAGTTAEINVTAGEGVRDASPGAQTGQVINRGGPAGRWDGIFDYVDGTTLAARSLAGALALGGLGQGFRPVPDLQAYAILAPVGALDGFDIMSSPEDHAAEALKRIADALDMKVTDLAVVTHSVNGHHHHAGLIERMSQCAGEVVVPPHVSVEPPYLLSLTGLSQPRVHALVGAIGLTELAFAAALLDLVAPHYEFVFRPASIAGQRREQGETLGPLFKFTDEEVGELAEAGWATDRQYLSSDIVPRGSAEAAAIFAVTENDALSLPQPARTGDKTVSSGLLLRPDRRVGRVTITRSA